MRKPECGMRNLPTRLWTGRRDDRYAVHSAVRNPQSAFTLLEVLLVVGIMAVLASLILPDFIGQIEQSRLPNSAEQMRALLSMARSNAMFDGKRYRVRIPREDELDDMGGDRQPIIEREDDPVKEPEVYNRVTAPWVFGETLLTDVWCAQVRLGKPSLDDKYLSGQRSEEMAEELFEDEEPEFPPLVIEPDGTSEWATFVITSVDRERSFEDLEEDDPVIEVILDGVTGLIWLQRPFHEEELDMLRENNWPPVLRRDFLRPQLLTEDEVLEIKEQRLRT